VVPFPEYVSVRVPVGLVTDFFACLVSNLPLLIAIFVMPELFTMEAVFAFWSDTAGPRCFNFARGVALSELLHACYLRILVLHCAGVIVEYPCLVQLPMLVRMIHRSNQMYNSIRRLACDGVTNSVVRIAFVYVFKCPVIPTRTCQLFDVPGSALVFRKRDINAPLLDSFGMPAVTILEVA